MEFIDKINQLPQQAKDFFFSNDLRVEMEKACFLCGINDAAAMSHVSDTIAFIFSKDSKLSDLPSLVSEENRLEKSVAYGLSYELNKRIFSLFSDVFQDSKNLLDQWEKLKSAPVISEQEATDKVIEIEPWILEDEKEKVKYQKKIKGEEETQKQNIEEITILEGLKKYPEVGEQLIASEHIKLKIFPEPVRPSIKNWLSDYTFDLGYESHDSMTRGDYLFRSDNGKKLLQEDREKLSSVLKSYDENIPLSIDIKAKQVLFPENREIRGVSEAPIVSSKPSGEEKIVSEANIKFSSPQIFANERKALETRTNQPIYIRPASRENSNGYSKEDRDLPKNVINLKK